MCTITLRRDANSETVACSHEPSVHVHSFFVFRMAKEVRGFV